MAGTIAISEPSLTGVARFSRNRTSSPSRYILIKRRREPDSSHTMARKPGYLESRLSSASLIVAASTSTVSMPDVNFRSGVGMTTLSDMVRSPEYFFECRQLGLDHLRRRQLECVERFLAIPGYCENREIRFLDSPLLNEFFRNGHRHTAGGFCKDSFRFSQQ